MCEWIPVTCVCNVHQTHIATFVILSRIRRTNEWVFLCIFFSSAALICIHTQVVIIFSIVFEVSCLFTSRRVRDGSIFATVKYAAATEKVMCWETSMNGMVRMRAANQREQQRHSSDCSRSHANVFLTNNGTSMSEWKRQKRVKIKKKKNKEGKQVILKMQQHTLKPKHSLANYMGGNGDSMAKYGVSFCSSM